MNCKLPVRFKESLFFIRLTHWEFWPSYIIYIPVYFYFLWLALRSRSLVFFSAANPGVDTGGMYGESKWSVLQKVPTSLIPKTILIKSGTPFTGILQELETSGITFPLIAKPDIGERGFLVEKIENASSLEKYLSRFDIDFILQEYIDYACEYNVLFNKMPDEAKGKISSVTVKQYMAVTGDGKSTVIELMKKDINCALQVDRMLTEKPDLLNRIPAKDESVHIESIGNHSRGTKFFDGRSMADELMTMAFNQIAEQIPGMNIFRFDVKCKTPGDLKTGLVKIVELNGAGGEPTHIYETGYPLLKAWGDLLRQWGVIYKASKLNHLNGVPYMSFNEGLSKFRAYMNYKNRLTRN